MRGTFKGTLNLQEEKVIQEIVVQYKFTCFHFLLFV